MSDDVLNVILIILLFSAFGTLHSFLASGSVKKILTARLGKLIAFYRFTYVLLSLLLFYIIYILIPDNYFIVFDLKPPFDILVLIPQFAGLAGFFWTLKYFSVKEFLGINQIERWYNRNYDIEELDEHLTLRIAGPYKFCRHPLYFFSIVFLLFRPEMNLNYLTLLICISVYFYVGSFYEEKKLVDKFGEKYISYQKEVPRILPVKLNLFK